MDVGLALTSPKRVGLPCVTSRKTGACWIPCSSGMCAKNSGLGVTRTVVAKTGRSLPADIVRSPAPGKKSEKATLLLFNEGRVDSSMSRDEAYARVARHTAVRNALARGAVPIWMPRPEPEIMGEIEGKRLPFTQARDGQVPPSASFARSAASNAPWSGAGWSGWSEPTPRFRHGCCWPASRGSGRPHYSGADAGLAPQADLPR